MKKYVYVIFCMVMIIFVACNGNNPSNENGNSGSEQTGGSDNDNPSGIADSLLTDVEKAFRDAQPGIYRATERYWMAPNAIIAKGTDGSVFQIADATAYDKNEFLPRSFTANDDGRTFYTFLSGDEEGNVVFQKILSEYSDEETTSTDYLVAGDYGLTARQMRWRFYDEFYNMQKGKTMKLLGGYDVDADYQWTVEYERIADAGNFEEIFTALCKMVQTAGEIELPKDQFTQEHCFYGLPWPYDAYPQEMNDKRWVVPFAGKGRIENFIIYRQREWGTSPDYYQLFGNCNLDNIFKISMLVTGWDEQEAADYVNSIRNMTDRYYRLYADISFEGGESLTVDSYGNVPEELTEGYKGYLYPSYTVSYLTTTGRFSIEFNYSYVTYV